MPLTELDRAMLRRALALAEDAIGLSDPNPRVGCVIGRADGTTLGAGFTQQPGGPHAEIVALQQAAQAGIDVRGATAWVTLEPCSHQGRTPPCCDALIGSGIGTVVYGCIDPNPLVSGSGLLKLQAAGIRTVAADDAIAIASEELNIGFFNRMRHGRPWVRAKVAASLDGVTALANGASQWITGEAARADGHAWRRRSSVVLTGVGTVLADDPQLDVRWLPTARQPQRAVVDSQLRSPPDARIFGGPTPAAVFTCTDAADRRQALERKGVAVHPLRGHDGRVHLPAVIERLGHDGANEVHVEAGPTLTGALIEAGLVDELLVYLAPALLGRGGRSFTMLGPLNDLAQRIELQFTDVLQVGADLRLRARLRRAT